MNDPRALDVVQLTDIHLCERRGERLRGGDPDASLGAVLAAIAAGGLPDLFLLTGDLVQDPCEAAYTRLRDYLGNTGVPTWCLPGNHDDPELMRAALNRDGLATPRARRIEGWLVVLLDSTVPGEAGGELGEAELAALANTLSSYPDDPALVCLHHPPVALGSRWNDVRLLGTPSTGTQFLPGADEFTIDEGAPPGWRRLTLHPDGRIETRLHWLDSGITGAC